MKNISVQLQQFVVESLHPNILAGQRISINELEKWKSYISKEIEKLSLQTLKANLGNRNSRDGYIAGIIGNVTEISNVVNRYLVKNERVWKGHPASSEIKQCYVFTCLALENFIDVLVKRYPAIGEGMPFTDYSLFTVKTILKADLNRVRKHLQKENVGIDLETVVLNGISHLIHQNSLLRGHESYLKKLMRELVKRQFPSPEILSDYLIINDFNLPEFFLFWVQTWSNQLSDVDGLFEQREMLLNAKSHLFDISLLHGQKFPFMQDKLYNELNKFLSEKYALVKEKLKISRQLAMEAGHKPHAKRVMINLSVAQLGLFIRLQVEKGILMKEHIGDLFAFYARHFYTPNTDYISSESLQKKSSDVEHATAKKLKAHLIAMINWLNANYNLSNYN
ncbi:hypothetical protein AB6735_03805 [Mucilaginibacter sp. RCC_168]|uniref:hypothetical protein n=1 Tax=Mucilaginibacter sp. RCC_168 TaxID=3239221 RepID=UPI0035242F5D